jgi:hypothetical protein
MGRPKKNIDPLQVEKLAAINCSYAEMAAVLNCSVDLLQRRFPQVIEKGRETGKMSLKRKQYEVAMSGNVTMLIWLGKIILGQREEQPSVTITAHPSPKTDTALNEIKDLLKAKECSSTLTPPLSLVPGQGLLAHS